MTRSLPELQSHSGGSPVFNNPAVDGYLGVAFKSLEKTRYHEIDINISMVSTSPPLGLSPYCFMYWFLSQRIPLYILRTKLSPLLYLKIKPKTVDRDGIFVARSFQVFVYNSVEISVKIL